MARRNLCSIVQAVLYFFSPSTRCSPRALAPFFCVVTHHMARNQTGKGVRVSWKIVPAVTEVWQPQPLHSSNTPRTGHERSPPQRGQRNPSGHRSRARYARHASSVPKFSSNSVRFRGYSSTMPAYYILGLPESSRYPPTLYIGIVVEAVGMWESQQRFPRAVGRVENLFLVFQAFHGPAFSTVSLLW